MADETRVGIIGAGATGGYLAARLAAAGVPVTLVARGESVRVIRAQGISLTDADGRTITAKPDEVREPGDEGPPVGLVLFCVKAYDTSTATDLVPSLLDDEGSVVCLQNGVKNEPVLAEAVGARRVVSGVMYIGSQRVAPGRITCRSPARLIVGPYVGDDLSTSESLKRMFDAADLESTVDPDVVAAKWQKFLFNCGLNPLTAITGQRLGQLRRTSEAAAVFDQLVDEAIAVARASGAPLHTDARERLEATAQRMDISSSMAEDLEAGRPLELAAFSGYVIELGERHGVATPATRVVHGILRALDHSTER